MAKIDQDKKIIEESASLKDQIISHVDSRLDNFERVMQAMFLKLSSGKENVPPVVNNTPLNEFSSNSTNHPLSQNINNVFAPMGVSHYTDKPVILLDKFGKELAKGYVVMDQTAGVCHFKKVGIGEKKIWVEEVMEPDARLWDPPQGEGDYNTLAGYAHGGYVIWLECWLKYV
ncbi:hypothetical protein LguiA_008412 [Lonicera macranthoides]